MNDGKMLLDVLAKSLGYVDTLLISGDCKRLDIDG